MLHLTFEEISDFVAMDNLNLENRELATKVITHIRACDKCREAVGGMLKMTEILSAAKRSISSERKAQKEK